MSRAWLSGTAVRILREVERDRILSLPEVFLDCDVGGLTIHNAERSMNSLIRRGLLQRLDNGDVVSTRAGLKALRQNGFIPQGEQS